MESIVKGKISSGMTVYMSDKYCDLKRVTQRAKQDGEPHQTIQYRENNNNVTVP